MSELNYSEKTVNDVIEKITGDVRVCSTYLFSKHRGLDLDCEKKEEAMEILKSSIFNNMPPADIDWASWPSHPKGGWSILRVSEKLLNEKALENPWIEHKKYGNIDGELYNRK